MKNNIITIVLVIMVGIVAFWYLNKTDSNTAYLTTDVKTTDSVDAKYIYTILQQMAEVKLDDSVFSSQIFKSLKDNTAFFSPQPTGRNNPFSLVGTDFNVTSPTTQSAVVPSSIIK